MALRFTGNSSEIEKRFKDAQKEITGKVIRILRYCAESAINEARTNATYKDITGNLRASTGYVIIIDGNIVEENFTGEGEGITTGKSLAREIISQQPSIALVVVAGMKYASHVESKGRNVLTSAEQLAKTLVPNLLRQLR